MEGPALIIIDPALFEKRIDNQVNPPWRGEPEGFVPRKHLSPQDYSKWIIKYAKRVCLAIEGKFTQINYKILQNSIKIAVNYILAIEREIYLVN